AAIAANDDDEQEAERYTAAAIAEIEDAFGPDDPDLIKLLSREALILRALGRLDEAADLRQRSFALAERIYGPDHPALTSPLRLIGFEALVAGHGADALAAFDRVAEIHAATLGPKHPATIEMQGLRALALMEQDRVDEAVAVADATMVNLDEAMPGKHDDRA